MKQFFFFSFLFIGIAGFSQTTKISTIRPFSPGELAWMDSVNDVLGEVFFDSLMKADGKTGNLHGPDVFWGFRITDTVYKSATQFYYTRSKQELFYRGKTIYLLKSGPVFADGSYNTETRTYSTILRTFTDTLYNSSFTPGFCIIPGIDDTSKRCMIINTTTPGSILISGKVSLKNTFTFRPGNAYRNNTKITLFHFTPDENFTEAYGIPKGSDKNHLLISLDSAQLKLMNDSTTFLLLTDGVGIYDTTNNFSTSYFHVVALIDTPFSQIERVFTFGFRASAMYCVLTKEDRKKFRKFLRKK